MLENEKPAAGATDTENAIHETGASIVDGRYFEDDGEEAPHATFGNFIIGYLAMAFSDRNISDDADAIIADWMAHDGNERTAAVWAKVAELAALPEGAELDGHEKDDYLAALRGGCQDDVAHLLVRLNDCIGGIAPQLDVCARRIFWDDKEAAIITIVVYLLDHVRSLAVEALRRLHDAGEVEVDG